ncbi:het and ankyrin domain protein [Apiospora phragmitis]|uniref:Het and ankyrin domain protein n=1 Tax=Apiospora phragmitis TaxID=2905665 RepID=A0ABR1UI83_9PEZI
MVNLQETDLVSDMSNVTRTELACHFYKMNPKQYSSCATRTFQTISSVIQHLHKSHDRKGHHNCDACFQSFPSESALHAHGNSGVCRPTGGVPADELPP